jgi:hypothetical protein
MHTKTDLPHAVRVIDHCWIAMADGVRLAARIWLPADADDRPVPAILEYLPYRKRDGTAARDAINNPYLAGHGCACVRVDIRGNGESEGLMSDEYTQAELQDGAAVIAWIAAQPWCDGNVAMMGISWGGFNGLQIAALQPPALKTVITLASTDDRYADDIHYLGGCLLGENLGWGAVMLGLSSRPPDPALVGESWRATWLDRLRSMPFLAAIWLTHQRRDAYWRHGSVCEDYGRVRVPVLAIDGWADAYANAVGRLVARLPGPAKGIVGPWAHRYPHIARPEPTIGFLQEALRWFDRWLKGADTGVEQDPAMRCHLSESQAPDPDFPPVAGRWVTTDSWPPSEVAVTPYYLGHGTLQPSPVAYAPTLSVCSPQDIGLAAGRFMPLGIGATGPDDQAEDDAKSLCFDLAAQAERLELFGTPVLELTLISDRPQANLVARLCDVGPDGASRRITWGALNLTHRSGHETPEALPAGRPVTVRLPLNDCAHVVLPGQRLRLGLSTAYWPTLWPSPAAATLDIVCTDARLLLPLRPLGDGAAEWTFPEAEGAPPGDSLDVRTGDCDILIEPRTLPDGATRVTFRDDYGGKRFNEHGLMFDSWGEHVMTVHPDDPLSARSETSWVHELGRGDWQVRTESRTWMHADATTFHLAAELIAWEGGVEVARYTWRETIPRDGV